MRAFKLLIIKQDKRRWFEHWHNNASVNNILVSKEDLLQRWIDRLETVEKNEK